MDFFTNMDMVLSILAVGFVIVWIAYLCKGDFIEVHDNVDESKSDAATQWPLDKLYDLLKTLKEIHQAIQ